MSKSLAKDGINEFIAARLGKALKMSPREIDPTIAFDRYGMDSVIAVDLTGELSKWLRVELSPTLFYDYPTLDALSTYLAEEVVSRRPFGETNPVHVS